MHDDNNNVDKKYAKLYDIRELFEDYLSGPSHTIMQDPAQQKNHAKSWPPICHSMTNKVVLLFSSPLCVHV